MASPNEKFDQLIKGYVKPFLKKHSFKKRTLNFFKNNDDLYYLINFQKSHGNSHDCIQFYINLGIYSHEINNTIGKFEPSKPKIMDCHYHVRIEQLTNKNYQRYTIDENTRIENIATLIIEDLTIAIEQLLSIQTTDDLIKSNKILDYQVLAKYLLLTNQEKQFEELYDRLFKKFGKEERWSYFKSNLDRIISEVTSK